MTHPGTRNQPQPSDVETIIDAVTHLLPAQGPISIFIHHNTLHAFEHRPFEEAVAVAGRRLGCEPFLSQERYRTELAGGRITERDVQAVLAARLGERAAERVAGLASRRDLRFRIAVHGVPAAAGFALRWLLHEMDALARYRHDLPPDARAAFAAVRGIERNDTDEAEQVRALWHACIDAVRRAPPCERSAIERQPLRHRDALLRVEGVDTDAWIHPTLIRFTSAYLDQGLAHWPMPLRERGMHAAFLELYSDPLVGQCGAWGRELREVVADERAHRRTAIGSLEHSLEVLGVPQDEHGDFLRDTVLALRGWAGMVRQIEIRPDRVPAHPVPARLLDFLAVRLLLERAALTFAAREMLGPSVPLADLRVHLHRRLPESPTTTVEERAWPLFHAMQLCGVDTVRVERLPPDAVAELEAELDEFDDVERRRVLHLAYERQLRHRYFDALAQHAPAHTPATPAFQAVFCIDEREESFRRHLEEVEPDAETFGSAGFFGVAMYYRGERDAHARPLCPVTIRPRHYVEEVPTRPNPRGIWRRRIAGLLSHNVFLASRTLLRGAVLSAVLGTGALVPLVLRVLFPWLGHRAARARLEPRSPAPTRLVLEHLGREPTGDAGDGFTVEEMTQIVHELLEAAGMARRLSPLVLVLGHGSVSLNNPHESAHDCGACGGGRGGANARAFAQMANDPRVRRLLGQQGFPIDASTWFVGGERNTCNNGVEFFDLDLLPESNRPLFARAAAAVESARTREAHERCRRFYAVPGWQPPSAALRHVEARARDLAQPRPEYGHATNALCVVGRRTRTRGLFLDRRAFLVSYDPTQDADGRVLARLLAAVVPVVAGISLEYYFSYVDPVGYGCGTKLPHNVTSLLGVMDGAQSDLRTGLPWQMVEIHEPVRLTIVVECERGVLRRTLRADVALARLVRNRWLFAASLDPGRNELWEIAPTADTRHQPEHPLAAVTRGSSEWYGGKRGPLPIVEIEMPQGGSR